MTSGYGEVHPIERERVAEAAWLYLVGQGISPQAFADRIIKHPRTALRYMRESQPISRRAITNLIAGKAVKGPTISAVKQFICYEKGLPISVLEVDPILEDLAQKDTHYQYKARPSRNALTLFTGKRSFAASKTCIDLYFEVEYSSFKNVLMARARMFFTPGSDRRGHKLLYLSGYMVPSGEHLTLVLTDYENPERFIFKFRTEDYQSAGRMRKHGDALVFSQSSRPAQALLPGSSDAIEAVPTSLSEHGMFSSITNSQGQPLFEQDYAFTGCSLFQDTFNIGGAGFHKYYTKNIGLIYKMAETHYMYARFRR